MKLAYLGIIIGAMLLTSAIGSSHASIGSVQVLTKEKAGMILLLVKNGQSVNIYSLKLILLNGDIASVKTPKGWVVKKTASASSVILTTSYPIKARSNAVFFLGTNNIKTIITWSAMDHSGSTIDSGNARTIFRQTLDKVAPTSKAPTYISNAGIFTITTDKIFYNKNDKIFISGTLKPSMDLTITIYAPNGQQMLITDGTDKTGSFKALHVLHDAPSGTYQLQVRQADGYAETTFAVL